MIEHPSKLPDLKTTIFTTMGQLAIKHDAVNLSQGFPNFPVDPMLLELVSKAMKDGLNQYAPMQGIYSLRERISAKLERLYGQYYHPEHEITVTVGATQGLFTAISAFIKPGDEVIIFKPAYDSYEPAIELYGGKVVPVQLDESSFRVDWKLVKSLIGPKTKMVVINSPHNPTGSVFSKNDMVQLQELLKETNIMVLSDEVYEHMVFDGLNHESVAKYHDLASRSLICASFGKTFHVTGWKLGYVVGPKELMAEFNKVHQYNVFCINHPMQKAIAAYLADPNHYLQLNAFYQEKRNFFLEAIKPSKFRFRPAQGTYFQVLEYSSISDEPDIDFAKRLISDYKIASIPLSVFNVNNADYRQLRFCFAKTQETLEKAASILNRIG